MEEHTFNFHFFLHVGSDTAEVHCNEKIHNILNKLNSMEHKIMTQISDFQVAMDGFLANLKADIQALNDKITALQNSPGALSPADQASLDEVQAAAKALSDSASNPPVVPPVSG